MNEEEKPVNCGCGGRVAVLVREHQFYKGVIGYRCRCWDCGTQTLQHRTREEAIKTWNKSMCRKTGEWVTYEYPDKENCFYLQCSVCGKPAIWANGVSNFPPRFCPSCGAEMKNHKDRISNF